MQAKNEADNSILLNMMAKEEADLAALKKQLYPVAQTEGK